MNILELFDNSIDSYISNFLERSKELFVFQHVPKTAGSSIHQELDKIEDGFHWLSDASPSGSWDTFQLLHNRKPFQMVRGHMKSGHLDQLDESGISYTAAGFIRCPVRQTVSHFRYCHSEACPGFEQYREKYADISSFITDYLQPDFSTRYMVGKCESADEAIEKIANRFNFVGMTEFYNTSMYLLMACLGLEYQVKPKVNVTRSDTSVDELLTEQVQEQIRRDFAIDIAVHEFFSQHYAALSDRVVEHFASKVTSNPASNDALGSLAPASKRSLTSPSINFVNSRRDGNGNLVQYHSRTEIADLRPQSVVGGISVEESYFLYNIIKTFNPKNIVEIGVASGWSSSIILKAVNELMLSNPNADYQFRGIDTDTKCYYDRSLEIGYAIDEVLPVEAYKGQILSRSNGVFAMEDECVPREVDLIFIDANHKHPYPAIDLLVSLPFLKDNGVVVLHDTNLPLINQDFPSHGAKYLFEAIETQFRFNCPATRQDNEISNMGAFVLSDRERLVKEIGAAIDGYENEMELVGDYRRFAGGWQPALVSKNVAA